MDPETWPGWIGPLVFVGSMVVVSIAGVRAGRRLGKDPAVRKQDRPCRPDSPERRRGGPSQ
ncbi:hypothetical protein GCM10010102_13230 [Promicromonospora citrea]|uniref:Uncharacterized protein n=1 Tax=Promicromonospora citrea TaxID=43677 RepID=A0A8H9GF78_9MICO|nr:hypothetical protein GCM10010102_13230 [Promicromonospora citrea]